MTEGIIARFRTMAIARVSVLTGHVVGALLQTLVAVVLVLGVAVLLGYRADARPLDWLAALGVLAVVTYALTWFTVALGMASGSVETASNWPTIFVLLPFLGSGFVPTGTMPVGLRWFAEYQPFTPVMETLRGLLSGGVASDDLIFAGGWCAVIGVSGYLWARRLYNREPPG